MLVEPVANIFWDWKWLWKYQIWNVLVDVSKRIHSLPYHHLPIITIIIIFLFVFFVKELENADFIKICIMELQISVLKLTWSKIIVGFISIFMLHVLIVGWFKFWSINKLCWLKAHFLLFDQIRVFHFQFLLDVWESRICCWYFWTSHIKSSFVCVCLCRHSPSLLKDKSKVIQLKLLLLLENWFYLSQVNWFPSLKIRGTCSSETHL